MSLSTPFKLACGALLACGLAVGGLSGAAADARPAPANIDVVICLDVSNSMDGLIGSAKARLWDVVNELARARPTPNLRVALYSYGHNSYNRDAGWVRKDLDLTTDLDALYQRLFALTTRGGTEYVTRVCRDAVAEQKWSDDPKALKLIFVCGNEPANQDKLVSLEEAANKAKAKGIFINPIFCGNAAHGDAASWKSFSRLAGGKFASIDQNRGVVAIAAPQDKKLSELSAKLATTYIAYGARGDDKRRNQLAQDLNAGKLGAATAAGRAISKANGAYRCDDWDLVDRMKSDKAFDVRKVPAAELPEEMRKMTPEQRVAHVQTVTARRLALQQEVLKLNAEREAFIQAELRRDPKSGARAFDAAVQSAVREQAATRGIVIPEAGKK